jgi:DNA replication protein DnaC
MGAADEAAIREREQRFAELERAAKASERTRLWLSLIRQFGQRYGAATLDSFDVQSEGQKHVVEKLREYCANIDDEINAGRNVVLYGPPGTGKDHLLVALMRAAVANFYTVAWRDAQTLFSSFRDAIGEDKSESSLISETTKANVLAISDPTPPLGELSDFQRSTLFRIIDRRYRDVRPTWVTINVASAEEASQKIAPNIIDRLNHGALVLRCSWPSYRQLKKAN